MPLAAFIAKFFAQQTGGIVGDTAQPLLHCLVPFLLLRVHLGGGCRLPRLILRCGLVPWWPGLWLSVGLLLIPGWLLLVLPGCILFFRWLR